MNNNVCQHKENKSLCVGGHTYRTVKHIVNPYRKRNQKKKAMKRFAFKMFLKPGFEEEYEKRHAALWPELKKQIKEAGVKNYSIYWDKETNILFGYQEIEGEQSSQDMGADEITQKWWAYMADIMETNPDNSPVTIPIKEVFHLD